MATTLQILATQPLCYKGHIDTTFLHMCAKTHQQQYPVHMLFPYICQQQIFFSNATYMPHIQISSCACDTAMSLQIPHMNSLPSLMIPEILVKIHFTLSAYAPEQICPSHCICMSHYLSTVGCI